MMRLKHDADNEFGKQHLLLYLVSTPVLVFISLYAITFALRWAARIPLGKGPEAFEMALWGSIATSPFIWAMALLIYYGPGKAGMREEERQRIKRAILAYQKRYPDAKSPLGDEFLD